MAGEEASHGQHLLPPSVDRLREIDGVGRFHMERTTSSDIREERDDLKVAAEQSLNVILDLALDGSIRWVSPSWKDVIGTPPASVKGTPIADLLIADKDSFTTAVETMKKDDSRSQIVRFRVLMGPESVLRPIPVASDEGDNGQQGPAEIAEEEQVLNLEGQGIMVYDWASGGESHVRKNRAEVFKTGELTKESDNVDATTFAQAQGDYHRLASVSGRVSWCRSRDARTLSDGARRRWGQ